MQFIQQYFQVSLLIILVDKENRQMKANDCLFLHNCLFFRYFLLLHAKSRREKKSEKTSHDMQEEKRGREVPGTLKKALGLLYSVSPGTTGPQDHQGL